jgi:aldehyde:ferredoxin oxidoreductase
MTHKILRIDLTAKTVRTSDLQESAQRKYIGGLGVGARILYDEVQPGVSWDDAANRLILSTGPFNGTPVAGSGGYCLITKGCLTNGATSSQANGYFGAFLRLSGFETVVLEGASSDWVYIFIYGSRVEFRDATHLVGKDTWETEDLIKKERGTGKNDLSIVSIGPAGENLVKFAGVLGDRGHAAAHNGVGAVLGSKKVKALVTARGTRKIEIADPQGLKQLNKKMLKDAREKTKNVYEEGTSWILAVAERNGILPIRNLTTNVFPDSYRLTGEYYRRHFKLKPQPCWKCPLKHCHIITVTEGPYKGYVAEEPDYESFAAWGPLIGQSDPGAAIMLSDTVDRLGMDTNEAGWLMALVLECFEKGILNNADTDGLEMTWGNVDAIRSMLHRVARREGFGDVLAEGVMRAAQSIGGGAEKMGVFVKKGHAPRGHDHRARWLEMFDTATSDCGTISVGPQFVADNFAPETIVETSVTKRIRSFVDSLVVCAFPTRMMTSNIVDHLIEMLTAITGWNYEAKEASMLGSRVDNLLRAFNIRHGHTPELERPSPRYGSRQIDGPIMAGSVMPHWDGMLDSYYKGMGWDRLTGKPLPTTLRRVGLDEIIEDLWQKG